MTKKQAYLKALLEQSSDWIAKSLASPNQYMTKTHLALHKIALRRRGVNLRGTL